MGWGMLMGIGKGLRSGADSYGRIMDEKRKQDFTLQRDELSFERSKSLEALRNQNQTARDKTQRGYQLEDQATLRKNQLEDRESNKKDQLAVYEEKKKMDVKYGMELAEQTNEFNRTAKAEDREAKKAELEKIFMEDGEISFQEKMALASVMTGVDLSGFYKTKEGKPMTAEMLDKVSTIMMNNEKYIKMAEENPEGFFKEAVRINEYIQSKGEAPEGGGEKVIDVQGLGERIGNEKSKDKRDAMLDEMKEKLPLDKYNEIARISNEISGDGKQSAVGAADSGKVEYEINRMDAMKEYRKLPPVVQENNSFESWYKYKYGKK